MVCTGLGFGQEPATVYSESPLRAQGLSQAISNALEEAGCQMHDIDLRISDISGEQYFFKEAVLALGRLLHLRKEELPIWHHAECIGECGATSGLVSYIVACIASQKGYAPGPKIVCHASGDGAERAAAIFEYRTSS
jgi:3-oxoacyl-[acyl-carrier-protein] synthase-1